METSELIQLGLFLATFAIVGCSCWAIIETRRSVKEQVKFHCFTEYTKRYQDLILKMPEDLDISSVSNRDVDIYMRLYFDLCSEEFYLHTKGVIDPYVWTLWADGIRTNMRKEAYRTAWKMLGGYYDAPLFIHFMSDLTRDEI